MSRTRTHANRIENEFAAADIEIVEVPNGWVLRVTDARTGISTELDALEVEALTRLDRDDRKALVWTSGGRLVRSGQREQNDAMWDMDLI